MNLLKSFLQRKEAKFFLILVLILTIPLTVFISQKRQDLRQRAAESSNFSNLSGAITENSATFSFNYSLPPIPTNTPQPTPTPLPNSGNGYTNLHADLQKDKATFIFDHDPFPAGTMYTVHLSPSPDWNTYHILDVALGDTSPLISSSNPSANNPNYDCGKQFYWLVDTYRIGDGVNRSPWQGPASVNCPNSPSPTPIPQPDITYTIHLSTTADFSYSVWVDYAKGNQTSYTITDLAKLSYYCGEKIYWKVVALIPGSPESPVQQTSMTCQNNTFNNLRAELKQDKATFYFDHRQFPSNYVYTIHISNSPKITEEGTFRLDFAQGSSSPLVVTNPHDIFSYYECGKTIYWVVDTYRVGDGHNASPVQGPITFDCPTTPTAIPPTSTPLPTDTPISTSIPTAITTLAPTIEPTAQPTTIPTLIPPTNAPATPTSGIQATPTPTKSDGDIDGDGKVTLSDFAEWKVEYLQELAGQQSSKQADLNNDNKVDLTDFAIWKIGYLRFLGL